MISGAVRYFLYFPYVGNKETIPAAAGAHGGALAAASGAKKPTAASGGVRGGRSRSGGASASSDEGLGIGGGLADNLVHVFWMGRYLPRGLGGRDEQLKWTRPRKEQAATVPDRAWRRVRAFLFLGPQFEADRTKQALVPGAAYTRALLAQGDRRAQDRYCAWVGAAHKRFDEELWFDDPITVGQEAASLSQPAAREAASDSGRKVIEYRTLFVGGTKYTIGDRVEVRPMRGIGAARAEAAAAAALVEASSSASSSAAHPSLAASGVGVGASGGAGDGGRVLGTLQALYQIIDSYSREQFPMIDVVPQTADTIVAQQEDHHHQHQNRRDQDAADSDDGGGGGGGGAALLMEHPSNAYLASSLIRKVDAAEWSRKGKLLLNLKVPPRGKSHVCAPVEERLAEKAVFCTVRCA